MRHFPEFSFNNAYGQLLQRSLDTDVAPTNVTSK
jgi:hypothetical protein